MRNLLVIVLSFWILILTVYATANIFQSIWFRFYLSQHMGDRQKREFYVKQRYDIKWTFTFLVAFLLAVPLDFLIGVPYQAWWNLLCAFLFWLLLWGNLKTHDFEKQRLDRKNDSDT